MLPWCGLELSNLSFMTTSNDSGSRGYNPWITVAIVSALFSGVVIWMIVAVTGYFRLSSETAALRTAFMQAVPGSSWHKNIALRAGWFTTEAVRLGSTFVSMPPEPRAALNAVRGAEVGIYRLENRIDQMNPRSIFASMDRVMKAEGWERVVGVAESRQFVAVYWPHRKLPPRGAKCCVLVFEGDQLIVTSVRANLQPLFNLARQRVNFAELRTRVSEF